MEDLIYRTRELLPSFLYPRLIEDGVVPELFVDSIDNLPDKARRYPPIVYSTKNFSIVGWIAEYLLRARVLGQKPTVVYTADFIYSIVQQHQNTSFSLADCQKLIPFLRKNTESVLPQVLTRHPQSDFIFDYEYYQTDAGFQGHPDLLTSSCVYDVKNVSKFQETKQSKTVRKDETKNNSCLQVLTYYLLGRMEGQELTEVGLILPMQGVVLVQDVSEWDFTQYYSLLLQAISSKHASLNPLVSLQYLMATQTLGSHISVSMLDVKSPSVAKNLADLVERVAPNNKTYQVYFRANQGAYREIQFSQTACDRIANALQDSHSKLFVHGALDINLADTFYDLATFTDDLYWCDQMIGSGVVVHVGKSKTKSKEVALKNMKKNLRRVIRHAYPECPLLLETPAGQGTELLCSLTDFSEFYNSFQDRHKDKFKICVDTCHVFAAGYDPYYYLTELVRRCGGTHNPTSVVGLVHFNNSRVPLGQCNDAHSYLQGYIPDSTMYAVWEYCTKHQIPMVTE